MFSFAERTMLGLPIMVLLSADRVNQEDAMSESRPEFLLMFPVFFLANLLEPEEEGGDHRWTYPTTVNIGLVGEQIEALVMFSDRAGAEEFRETYLGINYPTAFIQVDEPEDLVSLLSQLAEEKPHIENIAVDPWKVKKNVGGYYIPDLLKQLSG